MNIFYLDTDIETCARYHCLKHKIKMPLETAQMLSTCAPHHFPFLYHLHVYKPFNTNHPCNKWLKDHIENYFWMINFGLALCKEYTRVYNKTHKSEEVIRNISDNVLLHGRFIFPNTPPPLCMPSYCKISSDVVQCYRHYYNMEKYHIAEWPEGETPSWVRPKYKRK